MTRRKLLTLMLALAGPIGAVQAAERPAGTLYKNPQCGCCEEYAKYLRQHGFTVKVVATHDLALIRKQAGGVPEKIEGCHTMLIDKYVVEGHVPVKTLDKLLSEKPAIKGISLPGMPEGSPGMSGRKTEPFTVYEIGSNGANPPVYARE
jgi:hypothetical protein